VRDAINHVLHLRAARYVQRGTVVPAGRERCGT
jgi:hypothetical protein